MNAQDLAYNRARPGKQPLGLASEIMSALIEGVCDRWFVVAVANSNGPCAALGPLFGVGLCIGDRLRRPVMRLWAGSWQRRISSVSRRA
jgi:hypothetical protein